MRQCATDQGLGDAASTLGIDLGSDKLYPEAVKAFQKGVAAGDSMSASFLEGGFKAPPVGDLDYLVLPSDPERSRRYKLVGEFIDANDGRNPKVPDIDQIVPLPPAKLPPWDGTFQWKKDQDAAVPPQKPSDEEIQRLASEKHLDPATGLPIPPPAREPIGTRASTGTCCPEDGVWSLPYIASVSSSATLRLSKGDTMPPRILRNPRLLPLLDRVLGERHYVMDVTWTLIAYPDQTSQSDTTT